MEDLERSVAVHATKAQRWASVSVVRQAGENADTPEQSKMKWRKIYTLFGARGESEQDEAFAAVNAYFLRNGASPRGKYQKPIKTAGGQSVEAGEIVKITGRLEGEIRQFLRGRLEDSYLFLKHNAAIKDDEELATIAENAGVPRDACWLLADWLGRDCPYFVGSEADTYNRLRTSKIANARAKQVVTVAPEDHVRDNAPETKMNLAPRAYNEDLY